MSKTVKQLAEELGVSKTTVMKKIDNLGLRSGLRKIANQFAIDEDQEKLILSAFSEKSPTGIANQVCDQVCDFANQVCDQVCDFANQVCDQVCDSEDQKSPIIDLQREQIQLLTGQLQVKDEQIAALTARNAELQQQISQITAALMAEQALHAGSIKQLTAGTERKGIFARLFSRSDD